MDSTPLKRRREQYDERQNLRANEAIPKNICHKATGVKVMPLTELVPGQIWVQEYPIHFAGCDFNARMTVIKISDTRLMLHSPCEIDSATKEAISALGDVVCIVAPGTYHHIHVSSAQAAFPDAETYICPGIER